MTPRSRGGSVIESASLPPESLSPVVVVVVPELLELVDPWPVDAAGAVVMSGVEPKPVWPMGDAWQAVTSRSAKLFRGLTSRNVAHFRPKIHTTSHPRRPLLVEAPVIGEQASTIMDARSGSGASPGARQAPGVAVPRLSRPGPMPRSYTGSLG